MEAGPASAPAAPGGGGAVTAPARVRWLVAAVATAVVAVDQLTKTLALELLSEGPVQVVWTLRLKLSFNTGAAFGLGRGLGPVLVVAAVVLLAALALMARRVTAASAAVALGAVIGGAVGNLVDRLVRGHGGAVVDFIDLQWWPAFNVADAAITCGALAVVLLVGREEQSGPPAGAGRP